MSPCVISTVFYRCALLAEKKKKKVGLKKPNQTHKNHKPTKLNRRKDTEFCAKSSQGTLQVYQRVHNHFKC